MQINIPLDPGAMAKAIDGNKTYITLAVGALVIAANHFGLLPPEYVPQGLDPNNWLRDEFVLLLGATGRSALKKTEPQEVQPVTAVPTDPHEQVERLKPLIKDAVDATIAEAKRQTPAG